MRHRNDIQGLRGVAVLLVVASHVGVPGFAGGFIGVDVFFVLSGFLITGLLLNQAGRDGGVSLLTFYGRRARRILPAAALTLVATDLVAYQLLNVVRARAVAIDSLWAAVFAANVHFGREGTNYFASWQPTSPLQHFWTLSVEEQFYLVWPAAMAVVFVALRYVRRRSRRESDMDVALRWLAVLVGLAAIGSLAWSIHATNTNPQGAYFSTFARAWELALGAVLAIAARRSDFLRWPSIRAVAGWGGLAAIAAAAVTFSSSTLFPGYAALLPTLGAALVIAAGMGDLGRFNASRLLASAPLRYVGDRSYAYYLWHWPVLIIAAQYAGHSLSIPHKLALAVVAFLISDVTYRGFENPIRRARLSMRKSILLWPASAAIVLIVGGLTVGVIDSQTPGAGVASAAPPPLRDPTLVALQAKERAPLPAVVAAVKAAAKSAPIPKSLTPPVTSLQSDRYGFPPGCAPNTGQTSTTVCKLGDTTATKVLVVFGDSFAQQWMPAILSMATEDSWMVVPLVNGSGCASSAWLSYPSRPWCPKWYRWAMAQAASLHPDVTLIGGEWGPDTPATAINGAEAAISAAKRFSNSVVVVGVPPFQSRQPVDCLLAHGATMKTCTTTHDAATLRWDPTIQAYAAKHHVGFIDTKPWFCAYSTATRLWTCPLVVNDTITRLDTGHVTMTYATELAPSFRAAFRQALFG